MKTTHVLMLIDASGSMAPHRNDTIGSFDTFLGSLIGDGDNYSITVALFSSREFYHVHARGLEAGNNNLRLDTDSYRTMGMTALYDATGRTITEFIDSHQELDPEDRVIMVTVTDGAENHSGTWRKETLKPLIQQLETGGQWQFMYLAQGLDGWDDARDMGYQANSYVGTVSVDTDSSMKAAAAVTRDVSRTGMRTNTAAGYLAEHTDQIRPATQD